MEDFGSMNKSRESHNTAKLSTALEHFKICYTESNGEISHTEINSEVSHMEINSEISHTEINIEVS